MWCCVMKSRPAAVELVHAVRMRPGALAHELSPRGVVAEGVDVRSEGDVSGERRERRERRRERNGLSPGCRGCRGCRGPVEGLSRVLSRGCRGAIELTPCVSAVEVSRSLSSVETVEVSRVSRAVEGVESIVCRESVPSLYTKGQTNRHTLSSEPD